MKVSIDKAAKPEKQDELLNKVIHIKSVKLNTVRN